MPSTPFRFADNVAGRPTISDPWTGVDDVGAFGVQFGTVPDFFAPPGGLPCNQPGGPTLFVCDPGASFARNAPYTFFVVKQDGPIQFNRLLDANLSFPVLPTGGTSWQAQPPFVGDTWQGASVVPQIVIDGDKVTLQLSRIQGNAFAAGPCGGCIGIPRGPARGHLRA